MNIRRAELKDASAIIATDHVAEEDVARIEAIENWLKNDIVLVAEEAKTIIGYGVYNHAFFGRAYVEMLMIHPHYRGQKIGEKLLQALEEICETSKLFITTNLSNQSMQKLLIRLGYHSCGFIEELDPGDPELVFVKKLKEA